MFVKITLDQCRQLRIARKRSPPGGPTDLQRGSDTMLELWLGITQPYKTGLLGEDCLHLLTMTI